MAAVTPQDESSAAGRHLYQLWMKHGSAAVCLNQSIFIVKYNCQNATETIEN